MEQEVVETPTASRRRQFYRLAALPTGTAPEYGRTLQASNLRKTHGFNVALYLLS